MKHESETKQKLLTVAVDLIWESSYGSVSVDDICTKAGVNKGSFYHAFKSKSDLAVAAFERHWEYKRPMLDQVFSSQLTPMERLDAYCQLIIKDQGQKFASFGKMLGCPFCSVGSELSTQDEKIRQTAEKIGGKMLKYLESMIRDFKAEGQIECRCTAELAQEVGSYITGVLTQAKIENSMAKVERLQHGIIRLLGLKSATAASA